MNSVGYVVKGMRGRDLEEGMEKVELVGGEVKEEKEGELWGMMGRLKKEEN